MLAAAILRGAPPSCPTPTRRRRGDRSTSGWTTAAVGGRPGGPRRYRRRPWSTPRSRRAALAAFAVSGATAMTLQVLWTRALAVLLGSSVFSFTLILLAFLIGLGVGSAVFGRARPADAASGALAGGAAPGDRRRGRRVLPRHRQAAVRLHLAAAVVQLRRRRHPHLPVRARLHRGAAGDHAHGRRLPADHAHRGGRPRLGRPRRRQRLRAQHRGRHRRLVPVGLRGVAAAGPAARDLRRGAASTWRWRRVLFACAPGLPRHAPPGRRRRRGRAGAHRPGAAALEPGQLLVGLLPRLDRARVHRPQAPQEVWKTPSWSSTRTASPPPSPSISGARPTRSRTTARSTPRTTPTCRRRSSSGCCRCCSTASRHPPKVALVGYGSGVTAGAITQYPIASLEVVELEPAIYRALALLRQRQPPAAREPQGHRARRRRPQLPDPAQRQVRRHRQRAVEPLADRRLEPVHARVLPRREDPPGAGRHLLPVGAALRDGALEHQDHLPAPCARSSPTSTCSPPRICRRTRS